MKAFVKSNIPWIVASLFGCFSAVDSYYNNYSDKREEKEETSRCNVLIARQETDLDKGYFRKEGLEVRSTNNKKGYFWFDKAHIIEVHLDNDASDYFVKNGSHKRYLGVEYGKNKRQ